MRVRRSSVPRSRTSTWPDMPRWMTRASSAWSRLRSTTGEASGSQRNFPRRGAPSKRAPGHPSDEVLGGAVVAAQRALVEHGDGCDGRAGHHGCEAQAHDLDLEAAQALRRLQLASRPPARQPSRPASCWCRRPRPHPAARDARRRGSAWSGPARCRSRHTSGRPRPRRAASSCRLVFGSMAAPNAVRGLHERADEPQHEGRLQRQPRDRGRRHR